MVSEINCTKALEALYEKTKRTPWFNQTDGENPTRDGVYEIQWADLPCYSLWCEGAWHYTGRNPRTAMGYGLLRIGRGVEVKNPEPEELPAEYQGTFKWRGLVRGFE